MWVVSKVQTLVASRADWRAALKVLLWVDSWAAPLVASLAVPLEFLLAVQLVALKAALKVVPMEVCSAGRWGAELVV